MPNSADAAPEVAVIIPEPKPLGAATQVYVATHPDLAGVSGAYFEDCNPVRISGPNHVFDEPMARQLWDVSVEMTSAYLV